MAFNVKTTIKATESGVFEEILSERNIIVDGSSYDPLDDGTTKKYIIPAGTPMCPVVATKRYMPIRRTLVNGAVSNDTTVTVDDATPFQGCEGLGIRFYTSTSGLAATSTLRTISTVNTTTNVLVLTAAATIVDNDTIEAALNGAHGNADAANSTQIPDAVILKHDVCVLADDNSTTFHAAAVGVFRGAIRRAKVNGPGTVLFDQLLKNQLPNIDFLPTSAGTA